MDAAVTFSPPWYQGGAGGRCCRGTRRPAPDPIQRRRSICRAPKVPQPHHRPFGFSKTSRACRIIGRPIGMLAAVQLHRQPRPSAGEVDDVRPDDPLACPVRTVRRQQPPQRPSRVGRLRWQPTGAGGHRFGYGAAYRPGAAGRAALRPPHLWPPASQEEVVAIPRPRASATSRCPTHLDPEHEPPRASALAPSQVTHQTADRPRRRPVRRSDTSPHAPRQPRASVTQCYLLCPAAAGRPAHRAAIRRAKCAATARSTLSAMRPRPSAESRNAASAGLEMYPVSNRIDGMSGALSTISDAMR